MSSTVEKRSAAKKPPKKTPAKKPAGAVLAKTVAAEKPNAPAKPKKTKAKAGIAPLVLAERIVASAVERKAQDPLVLDVAGRCSFADALVILTAQNRVHASALAQGIVRDLGNDGIKPSGEAGKSGQQWLVVDYGDVVVHVMTEDVRGYYDLEELWRGAASTPSRTQR